MREFQAAVLAATFLLASHTLLAATAVWFAPLDPYFRQSVGYGGSPQYPDLFHPDAPWSQAAAHTNVFKIYSQWVHNASDADLKAQFSDLNRRGIALALETGVLTASAECGRGVEGQGGESLLKTALRIQSLGGNLRYIAMDEPIFFWTLYTGKNACKWTVDRTVANAAVNIRALRARFPDILIGDIEPFPVPEPDWLAHYQAGLEAFRKVLGSPPAFFDADVLWDTPTYLAALSAAHKMAASQGVPFGIIYNGNGSDQSNAAWIQTATRHMVAAESSLGSPDLVIFQSWNAYPKKLMPESEPDSFTSLINAYFHRRTTLTTSIQGRKLQGRLISADTGQGIARASISLVLAPTSGPGVPTVYAHAGEIPVGTQAIVFGARINRECGCSGPADLLVSTFTLDAGAAGTLTHDFKNQHISLQSGQPMMLNSAPVPFTSSGPYTLRVKAKVAPKSTGSGYFTLIFLSATKEITRVKIPFAPATLQTAIATTGTSGRFTFRLPSTPDPLQIQSDYSGSQTNWPAQSTIR